MLVICVLLFFPSIVSSALQCLLHTLYEWYFHLYLRLSTCCCAVVKSPKRQSAMVDHVSVGMIWYWYCWRAGVILAAGWDTANTRGFHEGACFSWCNPDPSDVLRRHVHCCPAISDHGHRVTSANQWLDGNQCWRVLLPWRICRPLLWGELLRNRPLMRLVTTRVHTSIQEPVSVLYLG